MLFNENPLSSQEQDYDRPPTSSYFTTIVLFNVTIEEKKSASYTTSTTPERAAMETTYAFQNVYLKQLSQALPGIVLLNPSWDRYVPMS